MADRTSWLANNACRRLSGTKKSNYQRIQGLLGEKAESFIEYGGYGWT